MTDAGQRSSPARCCVVQRVARTRSFLVPSQRSLRGTAPRRSSMRSCRSSTESDQRLGYKHMKIERLAKCRLFLRAPPQWACASGPQHHAQSRCSWTRARRQTPAIAQEASSGSTGANREFCARPLHADPLLRTSCSSSDAARSTIRSAAPWDRYGRWRVEVRIWNWFLMWLVVFSHVLTQPPRGLQYTTYYQRMYRVLYRGGKRRGKTQLKFHVAQS